MAALRDASELLWPAVEQAITALSDTLTDADSGAAQLARQYARTIDEHEDRAWAMRWVAPLLLDALEQLGATPAARARLKGGKTADAPVSQIAKLRAARRA